MPELDAIREITLTAARKAKADQRQTDEERLASFIDHLTTLLPPLDDRFRQGVLAGFKLIGLGMRVGVPEEVASAEDVSLNLPPQ